MEPLELVRLTSLMERTGGSPAVKIALLDGPVQCAHPDSIACRHGTFVASILYAKRGTASPAICPDCTLLVHPIFPETTAPDDSLPAATPAQLAAAISDAIAAGARILNLSAALSRPAMDRDTALEAALNLAAARGVLVIAAAGNQGTLGSTTITRHPWVIPVISYNRHGQPLSQSNLGHSIGRRGLGAPGDNITSLGPDGQPLTLSGTSVAAPFVTGAAALLWSEFPSATAAQIRNALLANPGRRPTVIPPLLDAWGAYQFLQAAHTTTQPGGSWNRNVATHP